MRLLLFVQREYAIHRVIACAGSWPNERPMSDRKRAIWEERKRGHRVSAWWEVECANAEAGRGTILALQSAKVGEAFTTTFPLGRVLASGRRAA